MPVITTTCVVMKEGLFLVNHSKLGQQDPIHVKKTWGNNLDIFCENHECEDARHIAVRRGKVACECLHVYIEAVSKGVYSASYVLFRIMGFELRLCLDYKCILFDIIHFIYRLLFRFNVRYEHCEQNPLNCVFKVKDTSIL
jgi:hypothetical protein